MLEIGRRTKLCVGCSTLVVSAVVAHSAFVEAPPAGSLLADLGPQLVLAGAVPALFVMWVGFRHDAGSRFARRQDEILPAEGARSAPFDRPVFRAPMAVLPLTVVFVISLAPALWLIYVPFLFFLEEWWVGPFGLVVGANALIALRESLRLIRLAYSAAAREAPPAA
jgi:hypothetical protein